MDDLVNDIRGMLRGGVDEQIIIEQMVESGADPRAVKELLDKAKNKPSTSPQPTPPRSQQQPPRQSQAYTPVKNQPNSTRHVKSENPDPVIKQTHEEATIKMNKIAQAHHITEQMISEDQTIMFFAKYAGWCLMVGDAVFSYWALKVSLDNRWIALQLAVGVGIAIYIMGRSIAIKTIDEIFALDKNDDGNVSMGERVSFGIRVLTAFICVSTDVLSNYMGMDVMLVGSLSPTNVVPGSVIAFLLAAAVMIIPQVIVMWSGINAKKLAKLKPLARIEAANVQGDTNYATGYQRQVATSTASVGEADGRKRVTSWKPWERR